MQQTQWPNQLTASKTSFKSLVARSPIGQPSFFTDPCQETSLFLPCLGPMTLHLCPVPLWHMTNKYCSLPHTSRYLSADASNKTVMYRQCSQFCRLWCTDSAANSANCDVRTVQPILQTKLVTSNSSMAGRLQTVCPTSPNLMSSNFHPFGHLISTWLQAFEINFFYARI
jgi:hypothetical protein